MEQTSRDKCVVYCGSAVDSKYTDYHRPAEIASGVPRASVRVLGSVRDWVGIVVEAVVVIQRQ